MHVVSICDSVSTNKPCNSGEVQLFTSLEFGACTILWNYILKTAQPAGKETHQMVLPSPTHKTCRVLKGSIFEFIYNFSGLNLCKQRNHIKQQSERYKVNILFLNTYKFSTQPWILCSLCIMFFTVFIALFTLAIYREKNDLKIKYIYRKHIKK